MYVINQIKTANYPFKVKLNRKTFKLLRRVLKTGRVWTSRTRQKTFASATRTQINTIVFLRNIF